MYKRCFKRIFDILISFMGILFLIPLFICVAVVIKIDSKGPALFVSKRPGKNKKPFTIYKFRTMRTDTPKDCATMYIDGDRYITKLGRLLRKLSIDELPQLFNVLIGNMSLIGPRPCGFSETELIEERDKQNAFSALPGITGYAQVNGRDQLAMDIVKKAQYDGDYCKNITFKNDFKILLDTVRVVLKREGIEEGKATTKVEASTNTEQTTLVGASDKIVIIEPRQAKESNVFVGSMPLSKQAEATSYLSQSDVAKDIPTERIDIDEEIGA